MAVSPSSPAHHMTLYTVALMSAASVQRCNNCSYIHCERAPHVVYGDPTPAPKSQTERCAFLQLESLILRGHPRLESLPESLCSLPHLELLVIRCDTGHRCKVDSALRCG